VIVKNMRQFVLRELVAPLLHGDYTVEYTARGVAVGLAVAFTPTVGIQIPVVFVLWWLSRHLFPALGFNLLVAIAWTWVSNVFTLAPIYYLFLVTGRVMLGRWERIRGFGVFQEKLSAGVLNDLGLLESLWVDLYRLYEQFGLPIWLGSIPWALLLSWIGYRWSVRLITRVRAYRVNRRAKRVSRDR